MNTKKAIILKMLIVLITFLSTATLLSQVVSSSEIEGQWLNDKYISFLKKNLSIQSLCNKVVSKDPLTALIIRNSNDTIFVTIIYGLGEGVEYTVYSQKREGDVIVMELGQDGKSMNEKLEFHKADNKVTYKKLNRTATFKKIKYAFEYDSGLEWTMNSILLSGTYNDERNKFIFSDSGSLMINKEKCKYRIVIDCSLEQNILEVKNNNKTVYYIFSRNKRCLKLWRAEPKSDTFVKKEKSFVLLRQNN